MAYMLTWTTYGTWLHGDHRSSVDDQHNLPTRPRLAPNEALHAAHRARMRHAPVTLDSNARLIVHGAIVDHAAIRTWQMLGLNVRSNHVHAVVGAAAHAPEEIVAQLKSWATRRLREAGAVGPERPVWTGGASTRWLWDAESLARASNYVINDQDRTARFV
jgi:REP element-mobilizing transposase RayT